MAILMKWNFSAKNGKFNYPKHTIFNNILSEAMYMSQRQNKIKSSFFTIS